jgi:hypothetical protein
MKSTIGFLLVFVFVFMFVSVAIPQTQQTTSQYTVKSGETLWDIAGRNLDASTAWESIYNDNLFLHELGRRSVDEKGRIIVKIYPGELLSGVNKAGIVLPDTPAVRVASRNVPIDVDDDVPVADPNAWLLWAVPLAVILFLLLYWLYSLYKKNPIQWRPMIPEGIKSDSLATDTFEFRSAYRSGTLILGSQRKVRLSGIWGTQHSGILIPIPHRYNQERAWQARFRMPDGMERVGYMLQGCGNDVSAGAWYIPFPGARVIEGWGDEAAPSATPPASPVQQAPAAAQNVAEEEIPDGVVRFELKHADGEMPAMFRISGINEKGNTSCEIKKGSVTVRFTTRS